MAKTERKPFEVERDIAAAVAERHELVSSGKATVAEDESMSAKIVALKGELNAIYTRGAVGENLTGIKLGPGKYEIGDGTSIEVKNDDTGEVVEVPRRARGETPEECVANWNDENYFIKAGGVGIVKN